jgi:hypothetical protein
MITITDANKSLQISTEQLEILIVQISNYSYFVLSIAEFCQAARQTVNYAPDLEPIRN